MKYNGKKPIHIIKYVKLTTATTINTKQNKIK